MRPKHLATCLFLVSLVLCLCCTSAIAAVFSYNANGAPTITLQSVKVYNVLTKSSYDARMILGRSSGTYWITVRNNEMMELEEIVGGLSWLTLSRNGFNALMKKVYDARFKAGAEIGRTSYAGKAEGYYVKSGNTYGYRDVPASSTSKESNMLAMAFGPDRDAYVLSINGAYQVYDERDSALKNPIEYKSHSNLKVTLSEAQLGLIKQFTEMK